MSTTLSLWLHFGWCDPLPSWYRAVQMRAFGTGHHSQASKAAAAAAVTGDGEVWDDARQLGSAAQIGNSRGATAATNGKGMGKGNGKFSANSTQYGSSREKAAIRDYSPVQTMELGTEPDL